MDLVTGAAIIVGLQKVGAPVAGVVTQFLGRILAPSGDALGDALANPIVEWQKRRVQRASRLVTEAAEMVRDSGREPHSVPARLLMPILDRGSLEDDEMLRQRWVALLANAACSPGTILTSFAGILAELSPIEANLLVALHELRVGKEYDVGGGGGVGGIYSFYTRLIRMSDWNFLHEVMTTSGIASPQEMAVVLTNLERLALIQANSRLARLPPEQQFYVQHLESVTLEITAFGDAFVTACSNPQPPA